MPTPREINAFTRTVHAYYQKHARDLPWRHTTDPYKILVSEIMLQQTQVERVRIKYAEFLHAFPTVATLAKAPLADVLRTWQGMGYNRRAKMLHETAKAIVRDHAGRFPKDMKTLITLPGIGPSTAGGILAYAHNMPVVFIETNIRRVYMYHFFHDKRGVSDKEILPLVEITCDKEHTREWYSALMDYGTHLAQTIENPNKRSKHYSVQKKFKGSEREVRGAILRSLAEKNHTRLYLMTQLPFTPERVEKALATLTKESLITQKGNSYTLGS